MTNETSDKNMDHTNGDQNTGVIPNIPGGKPQILPDEPPSSDAFKTDKMGGCASSETGDTELMDTGEKHDSKGEQPTIDQYFKPSDKKDDKTHPNKNDPSPKKAKIDGNESTNSSKTKLSVQSVSDNNENESKSNQRQSDRATRSSPVLPKLRDTFEDTDEEEGHSNYYSWAKDDIAEYRSNYPNARQDPKINDNYKFYTNEIPSHPDGDYIKNIHSKWFGDYRKLEYHHGYIQWLFPLQERGLNWSAEPLQKHEIESIKKDQTACKRILKSYQLMLDFYGFELVNEQTGELRRLPNGNYKERFRNLNTSSHNYLRITRILKCLGEFDYEHLKFPFLEAVLRESITENTLSNCLRSCKDYWIGTLRSKEERRAIRRYAKELIEYRNKELSPPKSHRAIRPPTPKIGKMSSSKGDDDNHSNQ